MVQTRDMYQCVQKMFYIKIEIWLAVSQTTQPREEVGVNCDLGIQYWDCQLRCVQPVYNLFTSCDSQSARSQKAGWKVLQSYPIGQNIAALPEKYKPRPES